MVDKNDPLLREVDEELRREQWAKLWEQYGIYAIAAAAAIVLLVGGFKFWEARQKSLAEAAGARYETARELVTAKKEAEATKAIEEIVAEGPKGYASLAELTLAGTHLKAGRRGEALAILDKLAADKSADELLVGYAALQAAALRLGEADYAEMQERLKPLAGDESPWRYNARELLGTAAVKAGKLDEARNALGPLLADPKVPPGTLARARTMMAAIATSELAGPDTKPASGSSAAPSPPTETPAAAPQ